MGYESLALEVQPDHMGLVCLQAPQKPATAGVPKPQHTVAARSDNERLVRRQDGVGLKVRVVQKYVCSALRGLTCARIPPAYRSIRAGRE